MYPRILKSRLGFVQLCASTASTGGDFQKTQTTHFSCWLTMWEQWEALSGRRVVVLLLLLPLLLLLLLLPLLLFLVLV